MAETQTTERGAPVGKACSPIPWTGVITSVRRFLTSTAEQTGSELTNDHEFVQWLEWPADVFALTAYMFRTTGCYRLVLEQDQRRATADAPPPDGTGRGDTKRQHLASTEEIRTGAVEWRTHVEGTLSALLGAECTREPAVLDDPPEPVRPPRFAECLREVWNLSARVTMEELRVLATPDAVALAIVLLDLHAMADEACAGIGILGHTRRTQSIGAFVANMLLVARGSLATFPKHLGVVLPKMRTPQSGLGPRSLAHHVTFSSTEVDVVWRALPWVNRHQHAMNVLAVPWPFGSAARRLAPCPDTLENVRYFTLAGEPEAAGGGATAETGSPTRAALEDIVRLVVEAERQCRAGVHLLVLPELALAENELVALAHMLSHEVESPRGRLRQLPAIVSGVAGRAPGPGIASCTNEVCLMHSVGGRWYAATQWKHHRWRLDRGQIQQYGLQGDLSTSAPWFEAIPIGQRRLTFVSASGWLTLCPLICEDLARFEPISEVIRGVGPTLLFALLMDGPQLRARWPARYATVLAEDPGTAVLSLTSLGMSRRARPLRDGALADDGAPDRSAVVALWKDASSSSAAELALAAPEAHASADDPAALLLSLSSEWSEEWTADGRSDGESAAVFRLDGARTVRVAGRAPHAVAPPPSGDRESVGTWADLRELSSAAFACDAALARGGRGADVIARVLLAERLEQLLAVDVQHCRAPWRRLFDQLLLARREPAQSGIAGRVAENGGAWPDATLRYGARLMHQLLAEAGPVPLEKQDLSTRLAYLHAVTLLAAGGLGARVEDFAALVDRTTGEAGDVSGVRTAMTARWRALVEAMRQEASGWADAGQLPAHTLDRLDVQVPEIALSLVHARLDPNRLHGVGSGLRPRDTRTLLRLINGIEQLLPARGRRAPDGAPGTGASDART